MKFQGLYAISDPRAPAGLEAAAAYLAGGAQLIQYRHKGAPGEVRRREAERVLALCHKAGVPLVVNDDVSLAEAIGADGVHLGRDDGDPARVRRRLGRGAIIGVSCYDRIGRAVAAAEAGADYVAFGSVYRSPTKPDTVRAPLSLLSLARRRTGLPVVAIGGILPRHVPELRAAGADMVAVIGGLLSDDPLAAALAYSRHFNHHAASSERSGQDGRASAFSGSCADQ